MYELKNGSARLVYALESVKEDPGRIRQLSDALYYCEDQLIQDIQALADYYIQAREKEQEQGYEL